MAIEIWNSGDYAGKYFMIETTALADNQNSTELFTNGATQLIRNEAITSGSIYYLNKSGRADYLKGAEYVIDCDDSRILELTPFSN